MHLSKENNPLPACRQINQYYYFQPYLWTDKQREKLFERQTVCRESVSIGNRMICSDIWHKYHA